MAEQEKTVGVTQAKARWYELLDRVAAGESFTITRRGLPVAQVLPVRQKTTPDQRREVIAAIRELAKKNRLRGLRIKDLMTRGRR